MQVLRVTRHLFLVQNKLLSLILAPGLGHLGTSLGLVLDQSEATALCKLKLFDLQSLLKHVSGFRLGAYHKACGCVCVLISYVEFERDGLRKLYKISC